MISGRLTITLLGSDWVGQFVTGPTSYTVLCESQDDNSDYLAAVAAAGYSGVQLQLGVPGIRFLKALAGPGVWQATYDETTRMFVGLDAVSVDSAPLDPFATASEIPTIPTALPPNGPAGGDLSGTYPNPSSRADAAYCTTLQPRTYTAGTANPMIWGGFGGARTGGLTPTANGITVARTGWYQINYKGIITNPPAAQRFDLAVTGAALGVSTLVASLGAMTQYLPWELTCVRLVNTGATLNGTFDPNATTVTTTTSTANVPGAPYNGIGWTELSAAYLGS